MLLYLVPYLAKVKQLSLQAVSPCGLPFLVDSGGLDFLHDGPGSHNSCPLRREPDDSHIALYALTSEVLWYHLYHTLLESQSESPGSGGG